MDPDEILRNREGLWSFMNFKGNDKRVPWLTIVWRANERNKFGLKIRQIKRMKIKLNSNSTPSSSSRNEGSPGNNKYMAVHWFIA